MDIRVVKNDFLKGLYLAQGIADRRATQPILANVLLRTDGKQRIVCAATDLNVAVTAEIAAEVKREGGVTLGAKHLFEIIKGLPGDQVHLRRTESSHCEIRAGSAEYRMVGMADRDFPKLADPREVVYGKIDAALLREFIAKTIFSVSTDETRAHLSGVLWECAGERLRMVSTDGHRLSKIERDVHEAPPLDAGVIVPRKGLLELRRLIEEAEGPCNVGFGKGYLFVGTSAATLSVKLVDAKFPPYDQVIPKDNDKTVTADRLALLDALRRVALVAPDRTSGVKFELSKGALRLSAENPDLGEAHEDMAVEYVGAALAIGFNARYLLDALQEMGAEEVRLELSGELDPVLVRPMTAEDYVSVVMPMRI
jgi:DNA polymerase III subunit beta